MNLIHTLVAFLVALTILVFVHELGHYLAAVRCGVKVLRFSIGFGPTLLRFRVGRDRTEWALSAIPLGGYVRMLGEGDKDVGQIGPEDLPRAFSRQSLAKRAFIVIAGPAANFLLAIVLYFGLGLAGMPQIEAVLDAPSPDTPAARAGLQQGDRVLETDGSTVRSWDELRLRMLDAAVEQRPLQMLIERQGTRFETRLELAPLPPGEVDPDFQRRSGILVSPGRVMVAGVTAGSAAELAGLQVRDIIVSLDGAPILRVAQLIDAIRMRPGESLRLGVLRGGAEVSLIIVPQAQAADHAQPDNAPRGRIGAALTHEFKRVEVSYGIVESAERAVLQTWDMSIFSLRMMGKMITGALSWRNLSGPVAIADFAGKTATVGFLPYLSFLALVSISLGVLNLLPVPVLDGGHLVYYGLEALRGRPLPERFLELTQKVGIALVLLLMVLALFNDLSRLIGS